MTTMVVFPPTIVQAQNRGSISRAGGGGGRDRRATTTRGGAQSTRTRPATPAARPPAGRPRPPAARPPSGASARAGYRAGYRAGSRNSWYDARRSYYRWRTVTGLFVMGMYFATRPRVSTTVVVTGSTYYYTGGVFYVSSGGGYSVVSAPPGAVVYAVPTHTTVVHAGETPYHYCNGTFYAESDQHVEAPVPAPAADSATATDDELDSLSDIPMTDDGSYEVIEPPVGATVPYLPDEADEETVDGRKYFVYEGTYYRAFASDDETVYMVVADPAQV